MQFKLQSKQGNEMSGHTELTKNHRLNFVEVVEPAAPGDPLSMTQGPGSLSFSVTKLRAADYEIDGEYEFDIE